VLIDKQMSVLASTANVRNRFTCAFTIAFFLGDVRVIPSRRTQPDAIKAAAIASTSITPNPAGRYQGGGYRVNAQVDHLGLRIAVGVPRPKRVEGGCAEEGRFGEPAGSGW